jgi:hypothetical protein
MTYKDQLYLQIHLINFRFNFIVVLAIYLISLFILNDSSSMTLCEKNEDVAINNKTSAYNYDPYFYFIAGSLVSAAIILVIIYSGGSESPSSHLDTLSSSLDNLPSNKVFINAPYVEQDPVTGVVRGIWDLNTKKFHTIDNLPDMYVSAEAFIQTFIAVNFKL